MNAVIIAVGSEMLGTSRLDTNSLEITRILERFGVTLLRKVVVGDDRAAIAADVRGASSSADLLVVSGGLGPTEDDQTKEGVAEALGLGLEEDAAVLKALEERFASRGYRMPEGNRKQALVFQGQKTIHNARGTAPGFHLVQGTKHVWIFPGVPHELRAMLEGPFTEWLAGNGGEASCHRRVIRIIGLPESLADDRLRPFYASHRDENITILASNGELQLHIASVGSQADCVSRLDAMEREVREILGDRVYGTGDDMLESVIGKMLMERGETVGVAESCTGGLLSSRLTDVSGSSRYFLGGVVAYTGDSKLFMLGVDPASIEGEGEVSEPVARQMANGARRRFGSTYGIGITGIAGPTGGTEAKPVGTVHLAVASANEVVHRKVLFPGDRALVKLFATNTALDMLRMQML